MGGVEARLGKRLQLDNNVLCQYSCSAGPDSLAMMEAV